MNRADLQQAIADAQSRLARYVEFQQRIGRPETRAPFARELLKMNASRSEACTRRIAELQAALKTTDESHSY